jgi:hypothetical protein
VGGVNPSPGVTITGGDRAWAARPLALGSALKNVRRGALQLPSRTVLVRGRAPAGRAPSAGVAGCTHLAPSTGHRPQGEATSTPRQILCGEPPPPLPAATLRQPSPQPLRAALPPRASALNLPATTPDPPSASTRSLPSVPPPRACPLPPRACPPQRAASTQSLPPTTAGHDLGRSLHPTSPSTWSRLTTGTDPRSHSLTERERALHRRRHLVQDPARLPGARRHPGARRQPGSWLGLGAWIWGGRLRRPGSRNSRGGIPVPKETVGGSQGMDAGSVARRLPTPRAGTSYPFLGPFLLGSL